MGSCLSKKGSLDVDEDKAPYERAKQGRSSSRSKKNKSKNKPLEADDDGQLEDGTVTDTVKEKPTPVPRKLSLKTASQDKLDAAEGNFDTPKSQPVPRQPIDESRPEKPERTFEYEGDKPHAAPRGVKPAKQETEGTKDNEKKASTPDAVKQSIKVNQTTLAAEVKHVKLKPHPESIQIAPMSDTPPPALKPVTPAVQTKPTIKQRSFDKPDSDANTKRITSEPPVRTNAELIQPIRPGKQHTFDRSGQNSAPVLPPRDVNAFLSDLDYDIPSTGHVVTVPSPRKPLLPPKATEEINPADVIVRIKQASQNQHPSSPVKIPEVTGKTVPPPPPKHPTMNTQDQGLYWVTDVTKQIPKEENQDLKNVSSFHGAQTGPNEVNKITETKRWGTRTPTIAQGDEAYNTPSAVTTSVSQTSQKVTVERQTTGGEHSNNSMALLGALKYIKEPTSPHSDIEEKTVTSTVLTKRETTRNVTMTKVLSTKTENESYVTEADVHSSSNNNDKFSGNVIKDVEAPQIETTV